MRPNKLRQLLDADKPSIGMHMHTSQPSIPEVVGHTGMFDYIEFVAEYAPFDLYSLENLCRSFELYGLSSMIKVDQEPRRFLAQRAIGAGFQGVLFADCRKKEDFAECVRVARPETPEDGGTYGVADRRMSWIAQAGRADYVEYLRGIVVAVMIEKKAAVENLEEVLSVPGLDMVQWGPADYTLSIGRPGDWFEPDIKALERRVIETALKMGIAPRAEITAVDQAKYYLDLGVKHFCLGTDIMILFHWLKQNGEELRKTLADY
jgi:4-hydroxy-2-oxoheptanedioate aldolase